MPIPEDSAPNPASAVPFHNEGHIVSVTESVLDFVVHMSNPEDRTTCAAWVCTIKKTELKIV